LSRQILPLVFLKKGVTIILMSLIKEIKKRIKKFKLNERKKKILIAALSFLVLAGLLFNFKNLFLVAIVGGKPIFRFT
jgi:hypothetical protein